jgi:hypothetical protein
VTTGFTGSRLPPKPASKKGHFDPARAVRCVEQRVEMSTCVYCVPCTTEPRGAHRWCAALAHMTAAQAHGPSTLHEMQCGSSSAIPTQSTTLCSILKVEPCSPVPSRLCPWCLYVLLMLQWFAAAACYALLPPRCAVYLKSWSLKPAKCPHWCCRVRHSIK